MGGICSKPKDSEADTFETEEKEDSPKSIADKNRLIFAQAFQECLASELRYISDVANGRAPRRHDQAADVVAQSIKSLKHALEGILPGTIVLSAIAAGINKAADRKFSQAIRRTYNKFLGLMSDTSQEAFVRDLAIKLANIYSDPLSRILTEDVHLVADSAVSHIFNYMAARDSLDGFTSNHLIRAARQGFSAREDSMMVNITNTRLRPIDKDTTQVLTTQGLLKRSGIRTVEATESGVETVTTYTHKAQDRSDKYGHMHIPASLKKLMLHEKDGWTVAAPEAAAAPSPATNWEKDLSAPEAINAIAIPPDSAFLDLCDGSEEEIARLKERYVFLMETIREDPSYADRIDQMAAQASLPWEEQERRGAEGRNEMIKEYDKARSEGNIKDARSYLRGLSPKLYQLALKIKDANKLPTIADIYQDLRDRKVLIIDDVTEELETSRQSSQESSRTLDDSDISSVPTEQLYSYLEDDGYEESQATTLQHDLTDFINGLNAQAGGMSAAEAKLLKAAAEERRQKITAGKEFKYTNGIVANSDIVGTAQQAF